MIIHIYTDGSKFESKVSSSFHVPILGLKKRFRIADDSSVYAAELTAIIESLRWILMCENENANKNKFIIFTDSLSVATSIKENEFNSRPNLFLEFRHIANKLKNNNILIAWIPSHIGLAGNEVADSLAKQSLELPEINSTNYLELNEIYALIKDYLINKGQYEYDREPKGKFYKLIQPLVSTDIKYMDTPRKQEVQMTRLRMGRVLCNAWLKIIGKSETDLCTECQVEETIEHIFIKCKKHNISNILHEKCLEKGVDFTIKNVLSTRSLYLEAYNLVMKIRDGKIL